MWIMKFWKSQKHKHGHRSHWYQVVTLWRVLTAPAKGSQFSPHSLSLSWRHMCGWLCREQLWGCRAREVVQSQHRSVSCHDLWACPPFHKYHRSRESWARTARRKTTHLIYSNSPRKCTAVINKKCVRIYVYLVVNVCLYRLQNGSLLLQRRRLLFLHTLKHVTEGRVLILAQSLTSCVNFGQSFIPVSPPVEWLSYLGSQQIGDRGSPKWPEQDIMDSSKTNSRTLNLPPQSLSRMDAQAAHWSISLTHK